MPRTQIAPLLGWGLLVLPFLWLTNSFFKLAADDVIPVFISTENWEAFYWGSSRHGSLIPLIASVVQDPTLNLRFQTLIHGIFLTLSVILISKLMFLAESLEIQKRVFLVIFILSFIGSNDELLVPMINNLPYAVSLGLFLLSIGLPENKSRTYLALETSLIILTCWLNPIIILYALPVLVCIYRDISRIKLIRLVVTSFFFGSIFLLIGKLNGERSGIAVPNFEGVLQSSWATPLVISQSIAFAVLFFDRKIRGRNLKRATSLFVASCSSWITIFVLPFSEHIQGEMQGSDFATRYFATSAILGVSFSIGAVIISRPSYFEVLNLFTLGKSRVRKLVFSILALLNIGSGIYLSNSYPLIPATHESLQKVATEFKNEKISFLSGNYWYTWPLKMQLISDEDQNPLVTSMRFENQDLMQSEDKLRSKLNMASTGICFGELIECENQVTAALELYKRDLFSVRLTESKRIDLGEVDAVLVQLKINENRSRCFLGNELPTEVGEKSGSELIAGKGLAGYLSFGPFVRLMNGSYSYTVDMTTSQGVLKNVGYVDVAVNSGPLKSSRKYFGENRDGKIRLNGSFSLNRDESNSLLEVRVFSLGKSLLGVKEICLKRN